MMTFFQACEVVGTMEKGEIEWSSEEVNCLKLKVDMPID
jgi:hypothetical protein